MPNKNGNAYGLTILCPIKNGIKDDKSYSSLTRWHLQDMQLNEHSPMAKVPETYMCRFYVLNDVFYEGSPAHEEHLKSHYLVFSSNFHGSMEDYLRNMWQNVTTQVIDIWKYCVAFDKVTDADGFVNYIKQCQVKNNLFFVGANDESLAEQLKALYLKQEFSKFVFENQKLNKRENASQLQAAFNSFIKRTQPENLANPSWTPGACTESINKTDIYTLDKDKKNNTSNTGDSSDKEATA
ncbi:hypothetical protein MNBD_GAMMA22-2498 [hydrothermal vent metagenome]|uniref:Uncharacterized protein n=1 Tax=hydrothermal vent metagenome TaxID=652676 RepID=A0A3B1A9Z9_9ZZZZ